MTPGNLRDAVGLTDVLRPRLVLAVRLEPVRRLPALLGPVADLGRGDDEHTIDLQVRLRQFFDHHLKGEPAPAWMTDGVPYLEKGRHMRDFAPKVFPGAEARATDSGSRPGGGPR